MGVTDVVTRLQSAYALSDEQKAAYRRDGHILLRNVCSPEEVAAFRERIGAAVTRTKESMGPMAERDTYGKAFIQTMNLWVDDADVKEFVFAKRFARIAAELMAVDGVRLYHDQALFKEPGGGHTPWHQDQYYWPFNSPNTITMWMPLVDISDDMGVMNFASGSHTEGYLGEFEISDESDRVFEDYIDKKGFTLTKGQAMNAGDVTFHSGWTLHNAPPNQQDRMREVMTVIYFADGLQVMEPDNKNRVADLETWLPGCKPGEAATSPINPVLWP